jgi:hypothetical protein
MHTYSVRQLIAGKKYEEGDGVDFEVMSDSFKADKMYALLINFPHNVIIIISHSSFVV